MSTKQKLGEAGTVSILVTMIMLMVISLIVVGFAQVARRNQREALDRQLASQAYYAAESGVNDVLTAIHNGHFVQPTDTTCTGSGSVLTKNATTPEIKPDLHQTGGQTDVGYTCLVVSLQTKSVVKTIKSLNLIRTAHLKLDKSTSLTFNWKGLSGDRNATSALCPSAGVTPNNFLSSDDWGASGCEFGALRVDLFDAQANGGSSDPETMSSHTAALYLMPSNSVTSTVNYGHASVLKANCTGGSCTATLTNGASQDYYVRISGIYQPPGQVTISSTNGAVFSEAQMSIDSTGRAQDELRRIQALVDLSGDNSVPGYAVQSGKGICKRFIILGNGYVAGNTTAGATDTDIPTELCSSGG